ncbi:MAG: Hsp70 family protein [Kofleriaceae bacterium]|nr:Hsp70 family protein [Kofleriaceae bacterium]
MSRAVGIDLGTSNSVVAVIDPDGAPRILTTADGSTTLPSLVWFSPTGPIVGEAARAGLDQSPDTTIFGAKRLLGRRFDDPSIRKLARVLPYELVEAPNGDTWIALSAGTTVSPEEVCALILRELKRIAEAHFGEPVTRAVITIPAWYDAAQRQATKDAAQIAGIQVMRLLSEPTAAALGHGAHRGDDRKYMVCDLGGGTFDVAVVDAQMGVFEVLATTGDPFLGGDDVDRTIVENLVRDVRATRGFDVSTDAIAIERLRLFAQRAKHELSNSNATLLEIPDLVQLPSGKAIVYDKPLRRAEIELWSSPLVRRLEAPIQEALARCSRTRSDVDDVLLVGGMTRMPAVQREIARVLGRDPISVLNPEEVVAVGAALVVARLEGTIEGILLIDVAARGLLVSQGQRECELVIAQSAVMPTREHRVFATKVDDQTRIELDVWEGESPSPEENRHLGRYAVVDLPPAPAGDVLVLIEITLDTDGTVRLGATELVSGDRLQLEQVSHAGLARADVARLAKQFEVL